MSTSDTPWDADGFRSAVESELHAFVAERSDWLGELGDPARRLVASARTSVSGGKRFRAAFCYWGHHAVAGLGEPAETGLLRACGSLELLHASALVHDDFMDASDSRRGRPSTHREFEALHQASGWRGSAEQYGASAAILLGDLLLSWADEMLRTCGLPPDRVLAAQHWFDLCRSEVVTGQFLDVSAQAQGRVDVDMAMNVLRYKSAKYSIERPLHIGAALGGADRSMIDRLTRFGLPLGEAFQLRDDLLGVFGDPEITGKPAGDDLTEGKRTVLIALALDGLSPADAARLDQGLGRNLDDAEVNELRALIDSSGAHEQVESVISALTDKALRALDALDIDEDARRVLRSLAEAATQRAV